MGYDTINAGHAAEAPAVAVSELSKRYGRLLAVDRVTFQVQHGEIFGLLGPNGAGKTTIIRVLTGLSRPSAGQVRVFAHDMERNPKEAKKLFGLVPEITNLYDELSALENVLFMAQLFGVPPQERLDRAHQLLDLFGLGSKSRVRLSHFSRGMKRAVAIAAAVVHRPRLLFLDEPTAGLDVVHARTLRRLVRRLNQEGVTVFLTTHYLEEADQLCDRIALLVKGRIVALDTPEALKDRASKGGVAVEVAFEPMLDQCAVGLGRRTGIRRVTARGDRLRVEGDKVSEVVAAIVAYAAESGTEITHIATVRPTLEEAFVQLTGLSSEVMKTEKGGS